MSFAYICQDFVSHVLLPGIKDTRAFRTVSCEGKCNQACMYYCPLETKILKVCFNIKNVSLILPQGLVKNRRTGETLISQESDTGKIKRRSF